MTKAKQRAKAQQRKANEKSDASKSTECSHLRHTTLGTVRRGKRLAATACAECAAPPTLACLQCGVWRCEAHAASHASKFLKKHPVAAVLGSSIVRCFACGVLTDALQRRDGAVRESVECLLSDGTAADGDDATTVDEGAGDDDGDDDDDAQEEVILVPPPSAGAAKANSGAEVSSDFLRAQLAKFDFAKARAGGVVGLHNLGNTCYFNSVLQCLMQSSALHALFVRPTYRAEPQLTRAFHSLMLGVWSTRGGSIAPRALLVEVTRKAPQFRGGQQQDAHELLRCLLDGMQDEEEVRIKALKAALASSHAASGTTSEPAKVDCAAQSTSNAVRDVFGGKMQSTVTCLKCLTPSVTTEQFLDIPLSVGPVATAVAQASSSGGGGGGGRAASAAAPAAPRIIRPRKLTKKQQRQLAATKAALADEADEEVEEKNEAVAIEEKQEARQEAEEADEEGETREEATILYYETLFVAPHEEAGAAPTSASSIILKTPTMAELDQRNDAERAFGANTIELALAQFTAPELLHDLYHCDECDAPQRAVRQMCVVSAPAVLTLCLKRFRTMLVGKRLETAKFAGHVAFPLALQLAPFCGLECAAPLDYELFGVVSHSGGNTRSGHYTAITRTTQGWTYFSDTTARASSAADALAAQAYLLFYRKVEIATQ